MLDVLFSLPLPLHNIYSKEESNVWVITTEYVDNNTDVNILNKFNMLFNNFPLFLLFRHAFYSTVFLRRIYFTYLNHYSNKIKEFCEITLISLYIYII